MPLSVPASHGYRSMSSESVHEQSALHKFSPLTPTTQSGDGPNIEANDTLWCTRSTRNVVEVLVFTYGYHKPAALISDRKWEPLARSSVSNKRTEPHSAIERKPSVAR